MRTDQALSWDGWKRVNVLVMTAVNVVEGISIANATQSYLASNVLVLWAVADGAKA
jgi:hypothetical protein